MEKIDLAVARIERVKAIVEAWKRQGSISGIERNIVLTQLAALYDELECMGTKTKLAANEDAQLANSVEEQKIGEQQKCEEQPVAALANEPKAATSASKVVEKVSEQKPEAAPVEATEEPWPSSDAGAEKQAKQQASAKKVTYLGEQQFNGGQKYLYENFGENESEASTRLSAIKDIGSAIGVNDRFLFIKELFGGDAKLFEQAILKLNSCSGIEDALMYIHQNFTWDESSAPVKHLVTLVRRRFI